MQPVQPAKCTTRAMAIGTIASHSWWRMSLPMPRLMRAQGKETVNEGAIGGILAVAFGGVLA